MGRKRTHGENEFNFIYINVNTACNMFLPCVSLLSYQQQFRTVESYTYKVLIDDIPDIGKSKIRYLKNPGNWPSDQAPEEPCDDPHPSPNLEP